MLLIPRITFTTTNTGRRSLCRQLFYGSRISGKSKAAGLVKCGFPDPRILFRSKALLYKLALRLVKLGPDFLGRISTPYDGSPQQKQRAPYAQCDPQEN